MEYEKRLSEHLSVCINHYCGLNNIKGLVIGISGGVDSAVTSILCAKSGMPVLCLELPINQDPNQLKRGKDHINYLLDNYPNVKSLKVDLSVPFKILSCELVEEGHIDKDKVALALANTRARLRMTTLYYYATMENSIVVGTGNKVEDFGVGFYTKYGDGGVDISPIGDLMKSDVYRLGKYLGVSEEILGAAPTDGLFGDSRTDEDQLGASYDELEWAMNWWNFTPKDGLGVQVDLSKRQTEVLAIYKKLHLANKHKMVPIPVFEIPSIISDLK